MGDRCGRAQHHCAHAFDRATQILQSQRSDLDNGVELLLKRETLTAEEFPAIRSKVAQTEQPTTLIRQNEVTTLTEPE
jgi:hypothetical protein